MQTHWELKNTYETLPEKFYSKVDVSPVKNPNLLILNKNVIKMLGLDESFLNSKDCIQILSGNRTPTGDKALSQAYAGHQYGYFTMLGDGRSILVGEQVNKSNELYDIQLKGSGKTPYSRGGDGRATLGSVLREYLISEAMHGLNIPTTRSLAVIETGEEVFREEILPGAILVRVAKSHIRIGTLQYGFVWTCLEDFKGLVDYAIDRHYPFCKEEENPYICFLKHVIKRQAKLIAKWQSVGFIHGVMNTDNMTISGETIDYGPCAFMDEYDENTVFSSIDRYGRYSYKNQPQIGKWNLERLAETLIPLLDKDKKRSISIAGEILADYEKIFEKAWLKEMGGKLGFKTPKEKHVVLINKLLSIMQRGRLDFTNTFLSLTEQLTNKREDILAKRYQIDKTGDFIQWENSWKNELKHCGESIEDSIEIMNRNNPQLIPRNNIVENALEAYVKNKDATLFDNLLDVLKNPYDYKALDSNKEIIKYQQPRSKDEKPYVTFCGT